MKKTVFVSSTYEDLSSYRRSVWDLLEEFDVSIRGMEQFGARTETPLETCIAEVEQSDIYLGIIAFRLGSIEKETGKSFTQLEYERAFELNKQILIYLIDEENARVYIKHIDQDYKRDKLEAFKRTLRDRHTIDTFVSEDDLVQKLRRDLVRYLTPQSIPGSEQEEFATSAQTLDKFLLVPKSFSGREIRLEVRIKDKPFPASKDLCDAFNFQFGDTVGVPVEILRPDGFKDSGLNLLFMSGKLYDNFAPVSAGESRDIYAKLEFADAEIKKIKTRFKPETYSYVEVPQFDNLLLHGSLSKSLYQTKTIHHEAEGRIILTFTKPSSAPKTNL